MARLRTRQSNHAGGTEEWLFNGSPFYSNNYPSAVVYDESCIDVADLPGVDHSFDLTRFEMRVNVDYTPINGTNPSGIFAGSRLHDVIPSTLYAQRNHVPIGGSEITGNDFAALQARTNPSRPVVTPLTLIQDVADIPKMLKDAGRLMKKVPKKGLSVKDIANQNLGIQFGWLPLVDDVKKLLDFQSHVHKRTAELNRLYSNQGLKRRIHLGTFNATDETGQVQVAGTNGVTGTYWSKFSRSTTVEKWGTIRWIPSAPPPFDPNTPEGNLQVRRIVGGLTPEGLTQGAWDVIPWTWLIDWFVNVGDYMGSHSNFVPAHNSHKCVMRRSDTLLKVDRGSNSDSWMDGGEGVASYTSLQRATDTTPVPFASMPFIGLQRLSILSSLFIQRFK